MYIDRNELFDIIYENEELLNWQKELFIDCVKCCTMYDRKQQHWIPCSTRLPSKRECKEQGTNLFLCTVLVNNDYKILDIVLLNTDYKTWHSRAQREVIAWRPLPQLYKEETK